MKPVRWLRRAIVIPISRWLDRVDEEKISGWQAFYYPMIVVAGLYLTVAADEPTQALAETLGPPSYHFWLAGHFMWPPLALIGRRQFEHPANRKFGARLQLIGDTGTLSLLVIYIACLINTSYWGAAVYPSFYLFMGIPGGAILTLRSWRRLRQQGE